MQNRLFFICPADGLESIINRKFRGENYYYTSLGDSVVFDYNTVGQIKRLIRKNNIKEISFVLSNDNPILLDALGAQEYAGIPRLTEFYKYLKTQNQYPMVLWHVNKHLVSVLSSHVNNKIKELENALNVSCDHNIKIEGHIFNRSDYSFQSIRKQQIIRKEHFHFN